jgi:ABC-type glutathione transport system ATPase component
MSAPLLDIRDLTVRYRQGRRRPPLLACDAVSLDVARAETVALVGESGSGKSTLAGAVLGIVPVAEGSIRLLEADVTHATGARRRALAEHVQVVFQDPLGSLNPRRTIGQALLEPLQVHRRLPRARAQARVRDMLERVRLPRAAVDRYPRQLSGGQRQRVAIARALMLEPELVICDEAVSALDLSVQAQVLNLLVELQRELGTAYLFISHDMAVVRHVAQRVVVLRQGRVVEAGLAEQVCAAPRAPYTRALLDATPIPDPVAQRARRDRPLSGVDGA